MSEKETIGEPSFELEGGLFCVNGSIGLRRGESEVPKSKAMCQSSFSDFWRFYTHHFAHLT